MEQGQNPNHIPTNGEYFANVYIFRQKTDPTRQDKTEF